MNQSNLMEFEKEVRPQMSNGRLDESFSKLAYQKALLGGDFVYDFEIDYSKFYVSDSGEIMIEESEG